jgi:hypothetical protein
MTQYPHVTLPSDKTARISVLLPWDPSRRGYDLLEDMLGLSRRGAVLYDKPVFKVSRHHSAKLIQALALEFDQVEVTQQGNVTETCVAQCWGAKRRTWPDCTCACLGENHGSGSPLDHVVGDGNLSVRHTPTERTFWVTAGEALI